MMVKEIRFRMKLIASTYDGCFFIQFLAKTANIGRRNVLVLAEAL